MSKFNKFFIKRKYETLLASLILLLFGQSLLPSVPIRIILPVLLIQNIIAGYVLFYENRKKRTLLLTILLSIIIFEFINYFYNWNYGEIIIRIIYIIYFLSISTVIYQKIYKVKEVNSEVITAVLCGFIMLCMIGTLLFMAMEILTPNSFSNLGTGEEKYENLNYFSFISTLTIGYGDIVPQTMIAKKTAMFFGLLGNFYMVFVVGIVIGKYLRK